MIQERINGIFDFIDNIIIFNQDYPLIDSIFDNIDFKRWDNAELIGFLSITFPFKKNFKKREAFYNKVYDHILKDYGKEETDQILKGLK